MQAAMDLIEKFREEHAEVIHAYDALFEDYLVEKKLLTDKCERDDCLYEPLSTEENWEVDVDMYLFLNGGADPYDIVRLSISAQDVLRLEKEGKITSSDFYRFCDPDFRYEMKSRPSWERTYLEVNEELLRERQQQLRHERSPIVYESCEYNPFGLSEEELEKHRQRHFERLWKHYPLDAKYYYPDFRKRVRR